MAGVGGGLDKELGSYCLKSRGELFLAPLHK
jgi:hypothetical protein